MVFILFDAIRNLGSKQYQSINPEENLLSGTLPAKTVIKMPCASADKVDYIAAVLSTANRISEFAEKLPPFTITKENKDSVIFKLNKPMSRQEMSSFIKEYRLMPAEKVDAFVANLGRSKFSLPSPHLSPSSKIS
jgi:hypothetical protein